MFLKVFNWRTKVHEQLPEISCDLCTTTDKVKKRKCCNAVYCDICYTKNRACPNCSIATRLEKLTGATYALPHISEHEECRVCLDPGLLRRCCGSYYCDECFFSAAQCRACSKPVNASLLAASLPKIPVSLPLLLFSLVPLLFLVTAALLISLFIYFSNQNSPQGLYGHQCLPPSFSLAVSSSTSFSTLLCPLDVCFEMSESVALGQSSLPPLPWTPCDLNSKVKLRTAGCVFDSQLYHSSGNLMGLEACSKAFPRGVIIFEDSFEHWEDSSDYSTNLMKSALWSQVIHGISSDVCGKNPLSLGGKKSLAFYGSGFREARTIAFDLSGGGEIQFDLFIAPLSATESPLCLANYGGDVAVEYSTDNFATSNVIFLFTAAIYRDRGFFRSTLPLPPESWTNNTSIRIRQPSFFAAADGWAIDNVRVIAHFPTGWVHSEGFKTNKKISKSVIQKAQCCSDTDWCDSRLNSNQIESCSSLFPNSPIPINYVRNNVSNSIKNITDVDSLEYIIKSDTTINNSFSVPYSLRSCEMVVLVCVAINILRFFTLLVIQWQSGRRWPGQQLFRLIANSQFVTRFLPARYQRSSAQRAQDVHLLARLGKDGDVELADPEGDGARRLREEEIEKQKKLDRKEKRRLAKIEMKKLKERMRLKKNRIHRIVPENEKTLKNMSNSTSSFDDDDDDDDDSDSNQDEDAINHKKSEKDEIILLSDIDRIKRQDLSLTRFAIEHRNNYIWQFGVFCLLWGSVCIGFLYLLSTCPFVTLSTKRPPYSLPEVSLSIPSVLPIFCAFYCDFKEVLAITTTSIPVFSSLLPPVTLDVSDGAAVLYIGDEEIPLSRVSFVKKISSPTIGFIFSGLTFIGGLPVCLSVLIVRDLGLGYSLNQIILPSMLLLALLRAAFGPHYLLLIIHFVSIIFSLNEHTREIIGKAFTGLRSRSSAFYIFLQIFFTSLFFYLCFTPKSINASTLFASIFLCGFAGLLYGWFAGASAELPVSPYIFLAHPETNLALQIIRRDRVLSTGVCVCAEEVPAEEILYLSIHENQRLLSLIGKYSPTTFQKL